MMQMDGVNLVRVSNYVRMWSWIGARQTLEPIGILSGNIKE